jgi:AcrR family transcriptional regulator
MAALEEFSKYGFSGARIDRIKEKAKVNVRMIYHFFDGKKGLLDAVRDSIFQERKGSLQEKPTNIADVLESYFEGYTADPHRVRLLLWESLESGTQREELNTLEDRKKVVRRRIQALEDLQKNGLAPSGIDPQLLHLFLVALTIYPSSYPQSVYVATGEDAHSSDFQQRYLEGLERFLDLLGQNSANKEV